MPQLAAETFASQLIWLAITFVILYLIMSRVVIPRVGGILEDREARIRGDLDKAEELKADADKAMDEYESRLAEARASAQGIIGEMKAEMAAETEKRRQEIDAELSKRQAEAESRIAEQRASALGSLDDVAKQATAAVLERLTGSADQDRVASAVGSVGEGR
jgi:F-type H+-transporting ATPase subunit b